MGLFSKLKDYNVELEEILDSKYFSGNIKSLLLSMIYKLEISYDDYAIVKRYVRSKEDFLNELIETIRLYCDNVKTVEPDSSQAKILKKNHLRALTNERERSILTYPTEIDLLYALSDISPKYFFVNDSFAIKESIQQSLVNGYNMSNVEILKDFNGWSWDNSNYDENFKYTDNLVYINLLLMLGEKFLYEWRTYGSTRRNFIEEARKMIKAITGTDNYYKYFLKTIYYFSNDKEKTDMLIKGNKKMLKMMDDRIAFLDECKNKKLKLTKKIEKIDLALNDRKVLKKELDRTNLKLDEKKKIKSLNKYHMMIEKEKTELLKELDEISLMLKPQNFLEKKRELKESLLFLECKETDMDLIVELQKEFLTFIEKRLSKMKTTEEIIDILYIARYYSRVHLSKDMIVTDVEELDDKLDLIFKKAITMLCKLGAIKIVSMDINLNYEIIKYALSTKIMNLEETKVAFVREQNGIIIRIFDKDVFEKQGRKKMTVNRKTLVIKDKRKIKLFN